MYNKGGLMESADTKSEALKIYKYNPLIRGRIIGRLTDFDFLLMEILLRIAQKEMRQSLYCMFNPHRFNIYMPELKKLIYGENKAPITWRLDVKRSLTRLRALTIELNNYEVPDEAYLAQENKLMDDPKNVKISKKVEFAAFGLCEEPKIANNTLYWGFSEFIVFWAWYKKNYTHLDVSQVRKLKSKYAQRIYEYIEYYVSINKSRGNNTDIITLNRSDFESIVNIENDSVAVLFQKIRLGDFVVPELKKIYPNIEITSPKRSNVINIKLDSYATT